MARTTMDFGIDLGTTNSSVAVIGGTGVEVVKNNEGAEYTPSAVWIDRHGRQYVGRRAKERLEDDPGNAFCEFKLQMGSDASYALARDGRRVTPETLSAEVLKSLRSDARQRTGDDVTAAVITVPAAFDLPQCEATKRAARLAGIDESPLLQEPIAAALAYGFDSMEERTFWLVYDLGGGTFDAAIVQVSDGRIHVVNHGGDNHLGGKLLDWAIVDELLVPALTREFDLPDFGRGNPKWIAAFAKLKLHAEQAKLLLSREESCDVIVDPLCVDAHGERVTLEFDLRRTDVERLAEPFLRRSIAVCRSVLAEKRLAAKDVAKVLLVGGPTLAPYLRERLADPVEGLGIPLEFRIDPLTVVARGAAIFAGTQRLAVTAPPAAAAGDVYAIDLEYKPVGPDAEPLIGGRVVAPGGARLEGFTIELVNDGSRPPWRSGKIRLSADGAFLTTAFAERGRANTLRLELCDETGARRETVPAEIDYTLGLVIADPPLTHSIGLALADGRVDVLFPKGAPLPVRRRTVHRTAMVALRGMKGHLLRVPLVEGENRRANRNRLVGAVEVSAESLGRDLPADSEVEVTVEIDKSRFVWAKAYVPLLDEEFESVLELTRPTPDPSRLSEEFEYERKRLARLRRKAYAADDSPSLALLASLDADGREHEIERLLAAAPVDRDAADTCQSRLLQLKERVDEIEDLVEWPTLLGNANWHLERAERYMPEYGTPHEQAASEALVEETRAAVEFRDAELLSKKLDELRELNYEVLQRQKFFWIEHLIGLEGRRGSFRNAEQADRLFEYAYQASKDGHLDALRKAVIQLYNLLPDEDLAEVRTSFGSTIL
jgi:molecular chaperone DnaK